MNKKEKFKEFIKKHPSFVKSVNGGIISWQGLYELYDIYGENEDVFKEYYIEENTKETSKEEISDTLSLKNIISTFKEINVDEIKKNLESLQKAVVFLEDFVLPDNKSEKQVENVVNPKPLDNFFDD